MMGKLKLEGVINTVSQMFLNMLNVSFFWLNLKYIETVDS